MIPRDSLMILRFCCCLQPSTYNLQQSAFVFCLQPPTSNLQLFAVLLRDAVARLQRPHHRHPVRPRAFPVETTEGIQGKEAGHRSDVQRCLQGSRREWNGNPPPWPEGTDPCYHLYTLRLGSNCRIGRDELFGRLREKGIHCQIHYIPVYRQPYYRKREDFDTNRFPEAESYFSNCLSLPLFPSLDEQTFDFIQKTLKSLF